jgi:L-cysteine:1D-myo-inositol 2-amino-2-deoxy-alpha-D-glucopyranoside ligase
MVRLDGEKMSKSLGNLVFVSRLRADGTDPMAIRLAILAHHYRGDWDWTDASLAKATARLARWRAAVAATGGAVAGGAVAGPDLGPAAGPDAGPGSGTGTAGAGAAVAGAVEVEAADAGAAVLAGVRERLADDLDAPGALAVVDEWAAAVSAGTVTAGGALVHDTVDALLGVLL